jgi:hypothetical protein
MKVNTNMMVTTTNDRDRQIVAAMFGDVVGILAANNLDHNLSSYEVVDDEEAFQGLAIWEKELLESGHDHKKCEDEVQAHLAKGETHKPGFPYEIEPPASDVEETAKFLVADSVNSWTGLSYPHTAFEIVAVRRNEDGWVAVLKCNDRDEYRYEVTRKNSQDETHIEVYTYDRISTIVGS